MLMQCIAEQPHIVSVFPHDVTFIMFTLNIKVATVPYKQTAAFLIIFFITYFYHYEEITVKLSNLMSQ